MKKIFFSPKLSALLIVLLCCFTIQCTTSQTSNESFSINKSPLPEPTGFVNDYVGVIDAATKQRLEQRLTQLKAQTNPPVEIAVAIVNTTGNRDISEYSLATARGWKIGSKEDDNPSALLLVAINDRKYFTQVSKDLQDELPDGSVGQLQRQYLVPAFKQQNYAKGIEDTIEAYIRTIEGKQTTDAPPVSQTDEKNTEKKTEKKGSVAGFGLCNIMVCLIILFILLIIIFSRSGKSRSNRNDTDRWGGGGGFGSGGSALPWVVGSILASSSSGSSSSDWGGGGGSSSDSGWGGFGGGGDFDGGGAGGDW